MGRGRGETADRKLVRGKGRNKGGEKGQRNKKEQKVARIGLINVRGERGKEDEIP